VRKRSGCYPYPAVDTAGSNVVSQAGGLLLIEIIRADHARHHVHALLSNQVVKRPLPKIGRGRLRWWAILGSNQ
jgi:hypothetical protein